MILSTALEKIFYHYTRSKIELFTLVTAEFFQNKEIQNCYKYDKKFYASYNQLPTQAQLEEMVSTQKENAGLDSDEVEKEITKIKSIFKIKLNEYTEEYLKENAEAWIEWKTLDTSFFDAINLMKTTKVDIHNIKEVVQKVKQIILDRNNLSFDFSMGLNFYNPEDHYSEDTEAFTTGYPFFDACLGGGYRKGTLHVIISGSGVGKSIVGGNLAISLIKTGRNAAFISLEMGEHDVIARIGSNILDVSINEYSEFAKDLSKLKKKLNKFKKGDGSTLITPGHLYIKEYPTSSAGIPEFESYLKKVEEIQKIKFSVIYVDYINICANWRNPNTENSYSKIKQLAEDLRAMGRRNDWAIVTFSQVNRSGLKNSDLAMENTSESMGLAHTVDSMFGLHQDEEQRANGIYIIKNIKSRNSGEVNSKKRFLIDYTHMRLTEDSENASYNMDDIFKDA